MSKRRQPGNAGAALGSLAPLLIGGAVLANGGMSPAPHAPIAMPVAAVRPAPPPLEPVSNDPAPPPVGMTPDCLARFQIDLPEQRGEAMARRETMVCRRGYVLAFNADRHDPDWVMERLAPTDLTGTAQRSNAFRRDASPLGDTEASDADYLRSGYDKGHQAPAGDAKFAQTIMDESFFFSNMAPQQGLGFNRGVWKYLEETVRGWVLCGGHPDLYVITGPILGTSRTTMGADQVVVPQYFFKIVYDQQSDRAVGFVLPNQKIGSRIDDLQTFVKPLAWIETETGLNFFSSFDQRHQGLLKDEPGTAWGHVATCAAVGND